MADNSQERSILMKYKLNGQISEIIFSSLQTTQLFCGENIFVIADVVISKHFPHLFADLEESLHYFEAKEKHKDFDHLRQILDKMQKANVNRQTEIIALGGGITTDLAAFAASIFKRGCRLILVPTTLLGMVDAAIGGKTGFNYAGVKNIIGSFYPAEKIIIDVEFLKTLSEQELQAGMVEIVKMSFLPNSNLSQLLAERVSVEEIIKEAIRNKIAVCVNDMEDRNSRRLLNLGHTFAHILEAASDYAISHGNAVSIGIRAAARYSLKKGFIQINQFSEIKKRLDRYALPQTFPNRYIKAIQKKGISLILQDKKADDRINLVLFKNNSELFLHTADDITEILQVLQGFADET